MDYFSLCLNAFCLAAQGAMHIFFVSRLTAKKQKAWHFFAYIFLLSGLEWAAGRIALSRPAAIGAELFILYGMNHFALGNRRSVSGIAAILAAYISQLSFGIVNSVEAMLFPYAIGKPLLYLLVLLAVAASLAVCACCYAIVLKFAPLKEQGQIAEMGLLLFPILFFFTTELYILQTSYTQTISTPPYGFLWAEAGKHTALLLLQTLGLGAMFCTLYAYRKICQSFQAQAALASLAQAAEAQRIYIREAQMRYKQTRAFRHDIQNHLSVLDGLLSSGSSEECRAYLQKLKTASDALSFPCQTGNPVVDILLGEKLGLAKSSGIAAEVSLLLPGSCGIDDFDLCVIFANALDNAIHACQEAKDARSIRISGERQGDFFMLVFENTCSSEPLPPMGTGLSNIQAVAEKYQGAMVMEKTGEWFSLHVLLQAVQP